MAAVWWLAVFSVYVVISGYVVCVSVCVCVSGSYHTGEMLGDVQTSLAHWRNYFPSVKWRIFPISKTSFLQPQKVPDTRLFRYRSSIHHRKEELLSVLQISLLILVNGSMTFYSIYPFLVSDGQTSHWADKHKPYIVEQSLKEQIKTLLSLLQNVTCWVDELCFYATDDTRPTQCWSNNEMSSLSFAFKTIKEGMLTY